MKQTLIAAIAMVSVASADMASLKADLLEEQESLNKLDIHSIQRRPVLPGHHHNPNLVTLFEAKPGNMIAYKAGGPCN